MSVTPLDRRRSDDRSCPSCGLSPMMASPDGMLTCPNRHTWGVSPRQCLRCAPFAAELVFGPSLADDTQRRVIRAYVVVFHESGHVADPTLPYRAAVLLADPAREDV